MSTVSLLMTLWSQRACDTIIIINQADILLCPMSMCDAVARSLLSSSLSIYCHRDTNPISLLLLSVACLLLMSGLRSRAESTEQLWQHMAFPIAERMNERQTNIIWHNNKLTTKHIHNHTCSFLRDNIWSCLVYGSWNMSLSKIEDEDKEDSITYFIHCSICL
jgi:hypothetical protein